MSRCDQTSKPTGFNRARAARSRPVPAIPPSSSATSTCEICWLYQDVADFFRWRSAVGRKRRRPLDLHNAFEACCAFKECRLDGPVGQRPQLAITGAAAVA